MTEDRCEELVRLLATLDGVGGIDAPLFRLEYVVRHLIDNNFVQVNKGTQMAHATWDDIMWHLEEEFHELGEAALEVTHDIGLVPFGQDVANLKEEIADLLALLVHATLKSGSTMKEIEALACDKMTRRFKKTLDKPT